MCHFYDEYIEDRVDTQAIPNRIQFVPGALKNLINNCSSFSIANNLNISSSSRLCLCSIEMIKSNQRWKMLPFPTFRKCKLTFFVTGYSIH